MNSSLVMVVVIYIIAIYSMQAIYIASESNTDVVMTNIELIAEQSKNVNIQEGWWDRLTGGMGDILGTMKFVFNFLFFNVDIKPMPYRFDIIFRAIFVYPIWILAAIEIANYVRGI